MGTLDNAPIGYTCPDIDSIIQTLSGVADRIAEISLQVDCPVMREIAEELANQEANIRMIYEGRRSPLEEIRSANDSLRKWGNAEYERANEAEVEIKRLNKAIEQLESI